MNTTTAHVNLFGVVKAVRFTLHHKQADSVIWVARDILEYKVGGKLFIGDLYRTEHNDGHVSFHFEDAIVGRPAIAIGWAGKVVSQ